MLTQDSVKYTIRGWRIFSKIGFLPLDFVSRYHPVEKPARRKTMPTLCMILSCLYATFILIRLFQVLGQPKETWNLWVLPLHVILAAGGTGANMIYYMIFIRDMDLNLIAVRALLSGLEIRKKNMKISLRELVLRYLAFFYPLMATILQISKMAVPRIPYSLRSVLPESPLYILDILCELCEGYLLFFWVSIGNYAMFMELFNVLRSNQDFKLCLKRLSNSKPQRRFNQQIFDEDVRELRTLQLRSFYYSAVFSGHTYILKLICQAVGVAGVFTCIKMYNRQPLLAVLGGYMGFSMWAWYILIFDKAYKLPQMLRDGQEVMRSRWSRVNAHESKIVDRTARSLWGVEVRMANFRTLERSSTPRFFDFALTAICNLIVAFPG